MVVPPGIVRAQIEAVATDIPPDATKIGMLANAAIIHAVAAALRDFALPLVVLDTVMIAKSRVPLLDPSAIATLRDQLLPLATVITPNVPEAEALTGRLITSVDDLRAAAKQLVANGARAALVKGGHLAGPAVDVLWDGRQFTELSSERIETPHTHGTGCTLSSAIAARLALGDTLPDACRAAKAYVTRAIAQAPGLGHGHGPVRH
jgi:hydroxymethylpyrimidine/phosphomethylpyrimidine kinase